METPIATTKRKFCKSESPPASVQESSPADKRQKNSQSPTKHDEEQVMAAKEDESVPEGLAEKIDLILNKVKKLDLLEQKMNEITTVMQGLQTSVAALEKDVVQVKVKQNSVDEKVKELETSASFVDEQIKDINAAIKKETDDRENKIDRMKKELLYLEAYSRRENLKFEGIPERPPGQGGGDIWKEDTRIPLIEFFQSVLGITDAKEIEFQRVHRMGKEPKDGNGRTIIARFLRYSDRERIFRCGRKLKNTHYKMYEDIPRELHDLRKAQMGKLKEARKEGKRAAFSSSQPDKLFIDGKLVEL